MSVLNGRLRAAVQDAVIELLGSEDEGIRLRALEALAKVLGSEPEVQEKETTEGEERVRGAREAEVRRLGGLTQEVV